MAWRKYANKVEMLHESKGQHIGKAPSLHLFHTTVRQCMGVFLKCTKSSPTFVIQLLLKYCIYWVLVPSLHRMSTDSLIRCILLVMVVHSYHFNIPLTAVHASFSVLCLESSSGVTWSILPPTPPRSCSFSQIRFHSNKLYPGCFCVLKSPADCFCAKLRLCAAEGSDKVEEEAPKEVAGCPCLEVNESCSSVMTQ